ncbi:hypothetical protein PsorP6_006180 [Peronosclerospora sorghi]|uniref:Uncharacterized protein n=1 Tax=Peronosclerospora sorghi TaxID=230839 RepID=A0ACC0W175_9STRA|nr:hypothetical protein PsorP6_006180 [Peronosclerospora sorghi]
MCLETRAHSWNRLSLQPASRTGAISVAGVKKYAKVNDAHDEKSLAVLAAANMDFDRLDLFQSVRMTANASWPLRFQKKLVVFMSFTPSSFSYRMDSESDKEARIWMSIQTKTHDEFVGVVTAINERGDMHAIEVASNELAKSHLRHLAGPRPENITNERLFRLEVPERPGALKYFLDTLRYVPPLVCFPRRHEKLGRPPSMLGRGSASARQWNASLFHYRNNGADVGRVLIGFQVPRTDDAAFHTFLRYVGFRYEEETHNVADMNPKP